MRHRAAKLCHAIINRTPKIFPYATHHRISPSSTTKEKKTRRGIKSAPEESYPPVHFPSDPPQSRPLIRRRHNWKASIRARGQAQISSSRLPWSLILAISSSSVSSCLGFLAPLSFPLPLARGFLPLAVGLLTVTRGFFFGAAVLTCDDTRGQRRMSFFFLSAFALEEERWREKSSTYLMTFRDRRFGDIVGFGCFGDASLCIFGVRDDGLGLAICCTLGSFD